MSKVAFLPRLLFPVECCNNNKNTQTVTEIKLNRYIYSALLSHRSISLKSNLFQITQN